MKKERLKLTSKFNNAARCAIVSVLNAMKNGKTVEIEGWEGFAKVTDSESEILRKVLYQTEIMTYFKFEDGKTRKQALPLRLMAVKLNSTEKVGFTDGWYVRFLNPTYWELALDMLLTERDYDKDYFVWSEKHDEPSFSQDEWQIGEEIGILS